MDPYRVPAPKDSITFAGLTLRDLIFAYAALRQESSNVRLKAFAMDGDSIIDNYRIENFSLYRGFIDSIPDELSTDWFFWNRLQGYFDMQDEESVKLQLAFSIIKGGKELSGFKIKKRYLFLIGDNWTGAKDSRYFGPIISSNVIGRPMMTLWGSDVDDGGKRKINRKRFLIFLM
jgi:hypothetical protein